jgi:hypothetical protein
MMHMTSSWRSCGSEVKDGRSNGVRAAQWKLDKNTLLLAVISFFARMNILVF